MHEAGIAARILEVAVQRARAAGAVRVTDVYLEVGEESGVDTESVALHWSILSAASIAQGARLHFEAVSELRVFRLTGVEVSDGRTVADTTGGRSAVLSHEDAPGPPAFTTIGPARRP